MKTWIHLLAPAAALAFALPLARAADNEKPEPKPGRAPMRVQGGPEHGGWYLGPRGGELEKENVTFLGVEVSQAPAALTSQLGLAPGTGLIVTEVAPKSAAEGSLQRHDVLLKLDDQIMIDPRQLYVLIRNHKGGDEVTLTYVRGGKQATAKIKLATREMPKMGLLESGAPRIFNYSVNGGGGGAAWAGNRPNELRGEEWDRMLSLLQRTPGASDVPPGAVPPGARIRIDHGNGPGFRAMSVNTGNSNLSYSDDEGSLDLTIKDGLKTLVAKNPKGEEIFSGPATTPEERNAMPPPVRARLEKLEGMHDVTFRTDRNFQGGEMRIMSFPPKEISFPIERRREEPPKERGGAF